ncbi:MAG TPA: FKBP-type peptidyl-prolyl cis-trans isomerase [Bacteroidales bacterium]|nr:FKBP-type peptidyl-prolyl cis-trans isomerase [Bacteroidales bacterium]
MRQINILIIVQFLLLSSIACQRDNQPEQKNLKDIEKEYKEPMMDWNQRKLRDQDLRIKGYAERRNWNMTRTGSGLYYEIYENGKGPKSDTGDLAIINYHLELLDGTYCYSSDSTGSRELRLGRVRIESGLEEGLLKMRTGDKARLIIPPHLGYGMPGDGNKIPSDATLVYHVELTELQ